MVECFDTLELPGRIDGKAMRVGRQATANSIPFTDLAILVQTAAVKKGTDQGVDGKWERGASRRREYERTRRVQRERHEWGRNQEALEREQERRGGEWEEQVGEEPYHSGRPRDWQQQQDYMSDNSHPQGPNTVQMPIIVGSGEGSRGGLPSQGKYNPTAPNKSTKAPHKPETGLRDEDSWPLAPPTSQRTQQLQQQAGLHASTPWADQRKPREPSPDSGSRQQQQPETRPLDTLKQEAQPQPQEFSVPTPTTPTVKSLNISTGTTLANEAVIRQERKEPQGRISNMDEGQVMEEPTPVTPPYPNQLYSNSTNVDQGALGSVYVSKVSDLASFSVSMRASSGKGVSSRVTICQMDLTRHPRGESIVNEILAMKVSQHPNIVNTLDAFLKDPTELWVVMEYMEGGSLTDVIDNNSLEEDQIATICCEVCFPFLTSVDRLFCAKVVAGR